MKTVELVGLINRLTTDKDEQQELWVHYLENSDVSALSNHLDEIRKKYTEEQLLQITLWRHVENPSDLNLQWLFDNFSELEQSIIRLLILGATLQQISGIKNIGVARMRHIVSVIREQKCWEELDGVKNQPY